MLFGISLPFNNTSKLKSSFSKTFNSFSFKLYVKAAAFSITALWFIILSVGEIIKDGLIKYKLNPLKWIWNPKMLTKGRWLISGAGKAVNKFSF